jgi:hypothetical protein
MALEHEMGVFGAHLMDLLGDDNVNEGKYVVIKGDEILPTAYDDYSAALAAGYDRLGPVSFLVKKIQRVEPVLYFTRDL